MRCTWERNSENINIFKNKIVFSWEKSEYIIYFHNKEFVFIHANGSLAVQLNYDIRNLRKIKENEERVFIKIFR